MKTSNDMEFLRLISVITHDAMTSKEPAYRNLIAAATKEAGDDVPSFIATFRYLHTNLSSLLIADSSDKT
jgi:hypothetical protein